eukprot:6987455-Prymnesium_polylepis.1
MAGIALTQAFGPQQSSTTSAVQFEALVRAPSGVAFLALMVTLFVTLAALVLLHERRASSPALKPPGRATPRCEPVHFAYPVVVGVVESLAQLGVIAFSRMLFLQLDGSSQLCHAAFWAVAAALVALFAAQVYWLRKALIHLEVTRVLPVEYGTVTSLS